MPASVQDALRSETRVKECLCSVLSTLSTLSTLPDGLNFPSETKVAAVRLSPNGRHLMVSNRGYDSIACYHVGADAGLTLYDIVDSRGRSPRDFNFLPSGNRVGVCNEFSDNVAFFTYDPESGALTYRPGEDMHMPRPLCLI